MSKFNKVFGWYATIISLLAILNVFRYFFQGTVSVLGLILYVVVSIVGVIGGIFLLKEKKEGWLISLIWSIIQIPIIKIGLFSVNFKQVLEFTFVKTYFTYGGITYSPGITIGINVIGIILVILLLKNKKKIK